jgi:hypothetical protein
MTLEGFEPATFRFLLQGLNQLHHRVLLYQFKNHKSVTQPNVQTQPQQKSY